MSLVTERLGQKLWIELSTWKNELAAFDAQVAPDLSNAPTLLQNVPMAVFAATLLDPEQHFPRAAAFLPRMAPDSVQKDWTGSSGTVLLETSIAFMQQLVVAMGEARINPREAVVLDFGVGWGRLIRLWLKYLPPSQVSGCDAWESSLGLAKNSGIQNALAKTDSLLHTLPFAENHFDLAYAFSIFTHLDADAFQDCLSGLARMLKPGGLIVFTVRPTEFWLTRSDLPDREKYLTQGGFVFRCESTEDSHFGDTTLDLDLLRAMLTRAGLDLRGLEWSPCDPLQVVVRAVKSQMPAHY
jgi:SAM-dependent methyltransferase